MKDITLDELKRLIATAQSEKAIQDLLDISKYRKTEYNIDNQTSKEILLISSRFKLISSKHRQGIISDTDFNLEVNKINAALVQIIERVENRIENLESSDKKLRRMLWGLGGVVLVLMLFIIGILFKDNFGETKGEEVNTQDYEDMSVPGKNTQSEISYPVDNPSKADTLDQIVPSASELSEDDEERAKLLAELEKARKEKQEADDKAEKAKLQAELEKTKREIAAAKAERDIQRPDQTNTVIRPPSKQKSGVDIFVQNYSRFIMDVGIGAGSVTSVSYDKGSGRLTIRYNYKNGKAEGTVDKYGHYEGRYYTSSSSGSFSMRFNDNGTSDGRWSTTFLSNNFSLKKK